MDNEGGESGCVITVIIALALISVIWLLAISDVEIRSLQRRVGQLEQQVKQLEMKQ